jgi:hypothetical protein
METGHVKQVATFEKLIGFCNAQGAMFNPSKPALQATALRDLLNNAQQSIQAVRAARAQFVQTMTTRQDAFKDLPKFMTRVINALIASGASASTVDQAYLFMKRFYPEVKVKVQLPEGNTEPPPAKVRSKAFYDFDSRIDTFEGLVKLISMEGGYQPNEPELQVIALQQKAGHLTTLNKAVLDAYVVLSTERARRNMVLYKSTGIFGIAAKVKRYLKSAFGYGSVPYKQVSSLKFLTR